MAPVPSKLAAHKGPQDLVFFLATRKVRPAIEGLLAVLRESADSLQASAASALTGAAETGAVAAQQAGALLQQVGALVDGALRGVAGGLLGGCGSALRAFLSADTPLHSKLPVAFVLWLLQLLYGAFVFTYLPAAGLALNSPISLVFHAFVFLTLASFIQAARTDPQGVPDTAEWRTRGQPPAALRERKRANGEPRWCRWEECYKPDRAHHCRALGRVVLRMDHHCPWLNNTVGFGNHKYFFLFLLYASGACAFFGMNVFQLLVQATLPALSSFLLVGAEGLAMLLGGILGPFFLFHCWLLSRNMTTVEFMDQRRARREREQERQEGKATDADADADAAAGSIYDIGLFRNICAVLGDNPLLWWLPVGGPSGDGLSFPVAHELAVVRAQDGMDARLLRGPWVAPVKVKINGTCVRVESPVRMAVGGTRVVSASPTTDKIAAKDAGAAWEQHVEAAQPEALKQKCAEVYVEDQQAEAGEEAEETDDEAPSVMEAGRLLWEMPSEFAQDLGAGCRYLGEAMAQLASEAAVRFAAVCAVGGLEEKKARRASWQRHAERSLQGLAAEGRSGGKLEGSAGPV